MDTLKLKTRAILRMFFGIIIMGAMFFWTAGTFRYWGAWLFLAVFFVPMTFGVIYLFRHDPELLQRRMENREERGQQRAFQLLGTIAWIGTFLVPGLDRRYGWSEVPIWIVLVAAMVGLAGYSMLFWTMRENRFAARTIRVEEGQTVVTTGPYAVVRHPMYLGAGLMMLSSPLILGSYWALIAGLLFPLLLVIRILDEEKLLLEELPGYPEYTQQTRYRLIPRVW
ncbi:MAG: isoprenylcysteine carboxylmethyltransferase family protein [Gemmatimonadetes bacterium]|nr:isoprenylcysteine carboxylmethyltransferase family protein [Gemmatimonadota bacterium]NNM04651.1 isoprenylcysteine carboxylmethyltransferase family protein [Gemmatimonadota bacterium]